MKLTQKWVVELDAVWTDAILFAAFDAETGGCIWWAAGGYSPIQPVTRPLHSSESTPLWLGVDLANGAWVIKQENLAAAVAKIVNKEVGAQWHLLGETVLSALQDNAPAQVDSGLADLIVQVALYGEVRH